MGNKYLSDYHDSEDKNFCSKCGNKLHSKIKEDKSSPSKHAIVLLKFLTTIGRYIYVLIKCNL